MDDRDPINLNAHPSEAERRATRELLEQSGVGGDDAMPPLHDTMANSDAADMSMSNVQPGVPIIEESLDPSRDSLGGRGTLIDTNNTDDRADVLPK